MCRRRRPSLHRAHGAREPQRRAVRSSWEGGWRPRLVRVRPDRHGRLPSVSARGGRGDCPGAAERDGRRSRGNTSPTGPRDRAPRRYARDGRWSARWRTPTRRRWRLRRRRGSRRSGRGRRKRRRGRGRRRREPRRRRPPRADGGVATGQRKGWIFPSPWVHPRGARPGGCEREATAAEEDALPWRVIDAIDCYRSLKEDAAVLLDVRPRKDHDREAIKGSLSPAADLSGGISDRVVTPTSTTWRRGWRN